MKRFFLLILFTSLFISLHGSAGNESPQTNQGSHRDFHPEFQKGVSYAYANGYDTGYASTKSTRSLDELQSLGVNWVAAIPYGFMRSSDSTEIRFAGNSAFAENDQSMFALAKDAKARKMKIMMKPQIWVSHRSWPGEIDFANETDWDRWFEAYRTWILHYAQMAESMRADLLCIGTELCQTTQKKPDSWRKLIADIREVYHGPLVYAANYGSEFERITFWDALDYMGLDNYYPVRSSKNENLDDMRQAFAKQKLMLQAQVKRFGKPLIFTEIGYRAVETAGMGTSEDESSAYNEQMQDACYKLAFETYWNENWFYGMYWWKWFSDPDDKGRDADLHSPHGRLAEKTIKIWYGKER
jgi:Glycoside Hydrolase Family 113